jgi:SHS2 domain-containing protein
MIMQKYKFLEDVALADIAYEAYGKDLNELFENAAAALFELTADLSTVKNKKRIDFYLEHVNAENLLYDFLSEILYLKDKEYMVFTKVDVKIVPGKKLKLNASLKGDRINSKTQKLENDIKAITMHMFKLEIIKGEYKSTIVVDL